MNKEEEEQNKDTAKERLHLVLMQDRANVSADFLEMMKQEIIEVIKKYIDVDENAIDVRLENKSNEDGTTGAPALYANIPIVSIKHTEQMKAEKDIDKEEKTDKEDKKEVEEEKEEKEENKEADKNKEIKEKEEVSEENNVDEIPEEDNKEVKEKEKIDKEDNVDNEKKEVKEEKQLKEDDKKEENTPKDKTKVENKSKKKSKKTNLLSSGHMSKRKPVLPAIVDVIKSRGETFAVLIGIDEGRPYEVFAFKIQPDEVPVFKTNKQTTITKVAKKHYSLGHEFDHVWGAENILCREGSEEEQAITRMVSTMLRGGRIPLEEIIDQIIKSSTSIEKFSKALAICLQKFLKDGLVLHEKCPNCGGDMISYEGCKKCVNCGQSKCG